MYTYVCIYIYIYICIYMFNLSCSDAGLSRIAAQTEAIVRVLFS